jgi:hypothetical protein
MDQIVLPSAYLPSIYYFKMLLNEAAIIDTHEHFVKQTMRNRCSIYAGNGLLNLTIPLQKSPNNTATNLKLMANDTNWKVLHWRSIASAYNGSAYFEYFEDDFKGLFSKENEIVNLVEWNTALINTIFKILRLNKTLNFSNVYIEQSESILDGRNEMDTGKFEFKQYYQIFTDKHGFISNLSILDLLFHRGLRSLEYL